MHLDSKLLLNCPPQQSLLFRKVGLIKGGATVCNIDIKLKYKCNENKDLKGKQKPSKFYFISIVYVVKM